MLYPSMNGLMACSSLSQHHIGPTNPHHTGDHHGPDGYAAPHLPWFLGSVTAPFDTQSMEEGSLAPA